MKGDCRLESSGIQLRQPSCCSARHPRCSPVLSPSLVIRWVLPSGAPIPPGFYVANQANWGCGDTTPRTCVVTEIPLFAWSTPLEDFRRETGFRHGAVDLGGRGHSRHASGFRLVQSIWGGGTNLGSRAWMGIHLPAWSLYRRR